MAGSIQRFVGAPTVAAIGLGAISSSTGSVLLDAALGAGIGYAISPDEQERTPYVAAGAAAAGVAGLLGVGLIIGYRYWIRRS